MAPVKILAFAGSARKDSLNKKLIRIAAEGARAAGAEVTLLDMREYELPMYDGDCEAELGLPDKAKELKKIFEAHDGLLIASPEHNSSYSAMLKNLVDWVSRSAGEGDKPLSAFSGKYAALLSTSPGALGGLRGLFQLRELLANLGVTVLPQLQAVGQGGTAFNDDGGLKDEATAKKVAAQAAALAGLLEKIAA
ncbi:MAG: NADPH-dependent FMN reductase [Alphaproteobacteria bacterium]|nr:NADPH-dependent FMN reductase [Alphaproteobacteria bacterium]